MRQKINNTNNQLISERQPNLVTYPLSEDLKINRSQLEQQLAVFKEAVKKELTFGEIMAIMGLWSPLLTSDFKALLGLTAGEIKVGYLVFSILLTIQIISGRIKVNILRYVKKVPFLKINQEKYTTDPEQKVEEIIKKTKNLE